MTTMVPRWRQVTWTIPEPLYHGLETLRDRLQDAMTQQPRWASVEDLATHLLQVAVQEVHREIVLKAQQARQVRLPGEPWP